MNKLHKQLRVGRKHHNYTHPQRPRYASAKRIKQRSTFSGILKTVTYNIKLSRKVDQAAQLLSLHQDLNDADIICLQEMDPVGVRHIAKTLRYNYVYYPAIFHPRSEKEFGNAILAKWPIIADEKIILPKVGTGHLQRIAVYATLDVQGSKISVVCVHMKVFATLLQRRIPIYHIFSAIDPKVKRCIIAGDFNTFTRAQCNAIFEPFKDAKFQPVTDKVGSTYKFWYLLNKKAALDHIFVRGMKPVHAGSVHNRNASDHIPIWGTVKLS